MPDVLDLRNAGNWRIVDQVADANGNGTNGTVEFLDTAGVATGRVLNFTEIETILGTPFTPPNQPPVFTNLTNGQTISLAENTTFVVDANATDADGNALTYSIAGGADAARFTIDPTTGVLSFVSAVDFEGISSAIGNDQIYDVTICVSDGQGGQQEVALLVNVTDVNETRADGIVNGAETGEVMNPGYTDAQGDQVDGTDGLNDTIFGNGGNDTINAGAGSDSISGGDGSDLIFGGQESTVPVSTNYSLYLNDSSNDLFRVTFDANGNATRTFVGDTGRTFSDIAQSADGQLYGVEFTTLFRIDPNTAQTTAVGVIGDGSFSTSLSFGTDGLFYSSSGSSIIRFDPTTPQNTSLFWTNPAGGAAAGDFLTIEDQMFVSWVAPSGTTQLLRLQLDASGTVTGSEVLGTLPTSSFGLALGPNGEIYSATQTNLLLLDVPTSPIAGGTGAIPVTTVSGASNPTGSTYFGATSTSEASFGVEADGNDTIDGGIGDDTILAAAGNDLITGGAGNDSILGEGGNDTITGGSGDSILGGADADSIVIDATVVDGFGGLTSGISVDGGSTGVDTDTLDLRGYAFYRNLVQTSDADGNSTSGTVEVIDGTGAVRVVTFTEIETLLLPPPAVTTDGRVDGLDTGETMGVGYTDPQGDAITDGSDNIAGNGGVDTIFTGGGNDTVSGGEGADLIDGGAGDDSLSGDADNDVLAGNEGRDTLDGGLGDDRLEGGEDADLLSGGDGADLLAGGTGDDTLTGDAGADTLDGGAGNDSLSGGLGNDGLTGGDGADTLSGGDGADTLTGGAGNDQLLGGAGVDDLLIGAGDLVQGGDGDDTFEIDPTLAGTGTITVVGGEAGEDLSDPANNPAGRIGDVLDLRGLAGVVISYTNPDPINGTSETGSVTYLNAAGQPVTIQFSEIEAVLTSANAVVDGTGGGDAMAPGFADPQGDQIDGADGLDDVLAAGAGNDTVDAGLGNDTVDAGDGNDSVGGGAGNDSFSGGSGADTLSGNAGNDRLAGGDGNDSLSGGDGRDLFVVIGPVDASGDSIDGGSGGDDFDTLDLGNARWRIVNQVTDSDGNGCNGTVNYLDDTGAVTGSLGFTNIEQIICFTPGTLIATPKGERPVEDLKPGDKVITRDDGIQELAWVGARRLEAADLAAHPKLRPVLIRAGSLGAGLPERDMMVSPNHRMLIRNAGTSLLFDEREVLAAAKHLTDLPGVVGQDVGAVTYVHVMCERHQVVLADGAWTESFQPGDMAIDGIDAVQRDELFAIFPDLRDSGGRAAYGAARKVLKGYETRLLMGIAAGRE